MTDREWETAQRNLDAARAEVQKAELHLATLEQARWVAGKRNLPRQAVIPVWWTGFIVAGMISVTFSLPLDPKAWLLRIIFSSVFALGGVSLAVQLNRSENVREMRRLYPGLGGMLARPFVSGLASGALAGWMLVQGIWWFILHLLR